MWDMRVNIEARDHVQSVDELLLKAVALQQEGRPLEAAEVYDGLLRGPNDSESKAKLYLLASSCLAQAGDLRKATAYTEAADKLNPIAEETRALLLFSYANLDFCERRFSSSVEKLNGLLERYDDLLKTQEFGWFRDECRQRLGFALFEGGKVAEARGVLESLGLEGDSADVRLYLARIDVKEKRFQKAEDQLRTVLAENPNHARALLDLGSLYLEQNRLSEAKEQLLRCEHIEADWTLPKETVLEALATAFMREGNELEAQRYKKMAQFHLESKGSGRVTGTLR